MMNDLNALLKLISTPAYFFDMATHEIVAVNDHFARLLEYSEAELLAMTIEEFRPEEDLARLRKALVSGPPEGSVEWRYRTRGGAILYVQITYRNSVFYDRSRACRREVRMVVVSKWGPHPTPSAYDPFG